MNSYLKDIIGQPGCLRKALSHYADYTEAMEDLAGQGFERVLFTGMGSSRSCSYGAGIWLNRNDHMGSVLSASQVLHYEAPLLNGKTLVVMVSQSGESGEIVKLIGKASDECYIVAVTNDPGSTLGRRGNTTLSLRVEPEESVTTRTYLASIILVDLLARALTGVKHRETLAGIHEALDAMDAFLEGYSDKVCRILDFVGEPQSLCMLGRGYSMGSVTAGALFMREVAKYPALEADAGEFRHGPMEMVDEGFVGVIFAPEGPTRDLNFALASDIADKGGKCVLITNAGDGPEHGGILQVRIAPTDEMFSPLVDILPVQFLANGLAEARGFVPGRFRWCSKVTSGE